MKHPSIYRYAASFWRGKQDLRKTVALFLPTYRTCQVQWQNQGASTPPPLPSHVKIYPKNQAFNCVMDMTCNQRKG